MNRHQLYFLQPAATALALRTKHSQSHTLSLMAWCRPHTFRFVISLLDAYQRPFAYRKNSSFSLSLFLTFALHWESTRQLRAYCTHLRQCLVYIYGTFCCARHVNVHICWAQAQISNVFSISCKDERRIPFKLNLYGIFWIFAPTQQCGGYWKWWFFQIHPD